MNELLTRQTWMQSIVPEPLVHSVKISWVATMCQALCQVVEIHSEQNRHTLPVLQLILKTNLQEHFFHWVDQENKTQNR